uniref:Mitochondrial carrier protein n=3 Tax=Mesocestoides corti TaxID=53468 RepID=A0A5K3F6N6_MESCO
MMLLDETTAHILGGGIGGTVGAIVTCPLELIKVRFQSSQGCALSDSSWTHVLHFPQANLTKKSSTSHLHPNISSPSIFFQAHQKSTAATIRLPSTKCGITKYSEAKCTSTALKRTRAFRFGLFLRSKIMRCMFEVAQTEGYRALFKGLIPTLVGVLPSRGIYFCAYHEGQNFFQRFFPDGHSAVFMLAAGCGSVTASTLTNPIWYVKTQLQLDARPCSSPMTVVNVVRSTWRDYGFRGFYRGISASYVGSLETAINFVVYENAKGALLLWGQRRKQSAPSSMAVDRMETDVQQFRGTQGGSKLNTTSDMFLCMCASAFSKIIAITAAYPHEVARTRMRERGNKYRSFVSTLRTVFLEEGWQGLYRGLGTHYIRQVPNSCVMIGTYEGVIYLLHSWNLVSPRE